MTRARETSENARLAKAWVNFDGNFGTSPFTEANGGIRSSFNVSSVTDLGFNGYYQINFASPFSDANWVMCGTARFGQASDNNVPNVGLYRNATLQTVATASYARIIMSWTSNTSYFVSDVDCAMLVFFHND